MLVALCRAHNRRIIRGGARARSTVPPLLRTEINRALQITPYLYCAPVKENMRCRLPGAHIGFVLVQRLRKWERDRKQIQMAAISLGIGADQTRTLNAAMRQGSPLNR